MSGLVLSARQQGVLRGLLASAPVPGDPIPPRRVLEQVAELVPCDSIGAAVVHNDGPTLALRDLPRGYADSVADLDPDHTGPLYVGLMHWSAHPAQSESCGAILPGHVDAVGVGFRNGPDTVAQLFLDRRRRRFEERDLSMLRLLQPVLERHLRQRATPRLPADLTVQERRVLMQVAAGESNAQIAETLTIAPATVRKHLENVFRKLGVTNRLAAVVALEGRPLIDPDRRARVASHA